MDLFSLRAVIGLDTSEYERGISNSSSLFSKAAGGIKKTAGAIGKTVAVGLGAAATAFGALAKASLDARGELEQNLGGSKQVFQEYADYIQDAGAMAYKQLGLSQSDYLATANKMGALLQGSGFDIAESMSMTTEAMQRAADVASIMGLDTAAAMEAIAGAAKGNFTMMDNLGVAINDTTLAQYALAQGITKSTQQMTTQEKVGLAMQLFMEKTAYAAGNYARENETLAGSLGTAKAAFDNFLSGAGTAEQLIESVLGAAKTVTSNLVTILPELAQGVGDLLAGLAPMLPEIVKTLLPALAEGAGVLISSLISLLPELFGSLLSVLPDVGASLVAALASGVTGNEVSAQDVKDFFGEMGSDIVHDYELLQHHLSLLGESISSSWQDISDFIVKQGPLIYDAVSTWFLETFFATDTITGDMYEAASKNWSLLSGAVESTSKSVWQSVKDWFTKTFLDGQGLMENLCLDSDSLFGNLADSLEISAKGIWESVTQWFTDTKEDVKTSFWNLWFNAVQIWTNIKTAITQPIEDAKTLIGGIVSDIVDFFDVEISWPDIPLPHFSISPKGWDLGDLLEGTIPSLSISWYNRAMNNPMLLRGATIFGMQDGQFLGGGDAGGEIVAGANTVARLIYDAVHSAMGNMAGGIVVNQNIYSEAKTAADLMQEARWEAERAVLTGV